MMNPAYRWSFCRSADPPGHDSWLGPRERAALRRFRLSPRRAHWRLGRWAAKRALSAYLGPPGSPRRLDLERLEILAAPDGAPEAHLDGEPLGLALSISHRTDRGAGLVAPPGVRLGIDLERIEPRSTRMMRDFFTPGELELVLATPHGEERHRIAALIWSAKESMLKAQRTGLRRDTRTVELVRGATPPRAGRWEELVVRDHVSFEDHHGWWQIRGQLLITLVATPLPDSPPEPSTPA